MRRKDKEITDIGKKIEIIKKCKICRIGLSENNKPYIVPLNYGWDLLESVDEKVNGLNKIIKHQTEMETVHSFAEDELKNVCVYKMVVEEFTGKGEVAAKPHLSP